MRDDFHFLSRKQGHIVYVRETCTLCYTEKHVGLHGDALNPPCRPMCFSTYIADGFVSKMFLKNSVQRGDRFHCFSENINDVI